MDNNTKYSIIVLLTLFFSCQEKPNYTKTMLIGEGIYKDFDEKGRIILDGNYHNDNYSGKRMIYEGDDTVAIYYYINDTIVGYERINDIDSKKWLIFSEEEELVVNCNKKFLLVGDTLKVKFIINHHITDTLKVWINRKILQDNSNFVYPTINNTKYIYSHIVSDVGTDTLVVIGYLKHFNKDIDTLRYYIGYFGIESITHIEY